MENLPVIIAEVSVAPSGELFRNTFFFLRMFQMFYRRFYQNTTNHVMGSHDKSRYEAYSVNQYPFLVVIQSCLNVASSKLTFNNMHSFFEFQMCLSMQPGFVTSTRTDVDYYSVIVKCLVCLVSTTLLLGL